MSEVDKITSDFDKKLAEVTNKVKGYAFGKAYEFKWSISGKSQGVSYEVSA